MSTEGYPAEFYDEEEIWHISRNNKKSGPFRFSDLVEAIDLQLIKATDFVWHHRWDDWRQVKSVPFLASLAGLSDCEQPESMKPAIPISTLVEKFEIELRDSPPRRAAFRPLWRGKKVVHFANLLLIGLTIFGLAALSTLVFVNSRYGIVCISIEFATLVLVGILITRKSIKVGYRTLRISALSAMATLQLIVMNIDRIPDAYDVWQTKRLLAHARTSNQIQRLAVDHPSNKFVELVLASNDAVRQSSTATMQLMKELEPQGITLDTMRVAPTRDQLVENARDLRAAAARAEMAMTRYLAILESERSNIERAGRKIYSRDPLYVLPNSMTALGRRQDILRERMSKTFVAIEMFFSRKGDVAEFLVRNWDAARSGKERYTFADQATSDKYYKLVALVRAAQTTMLGLERDNLKFDADQRMLWNVEIGSPR
jgi:hypothetical protein